MHGWWIGSIIAYGLGARFGHLALQAAAAAAVVVVAVHVAFTSSMPHKQESVEPVVLSHPLLVDI